MLEPALKICPIIGISTSIAIILYLFKQRIFSIIFGAIGVIFLAVIIIGVIIELKQDAYLFKKHCKSKNQPTALNNVYECEYCGARFKTKLNFCNVCGKSLKHTIKK
jgi:hypothetical protein